MIETIYTWLMVSSANPENTSLTIKAALAGAITIGTMFLGLANIHVGSADTTAFVDEVIAIVQAIAALVAGVTGLYGLIRKIWLTLKGQHAGLNALDNA